ncbi:cell wall-binding repeat-containing protein [Guggenheimella bovis]
MKLKKTISLLLLVALVLGCIPVMPSFAALNWDIDPVGAGSTQISGRGLPGATVNVQIQNFAVQATVVEPSGIWRVPVGYKLNGGEKIIVQYAEPGQLFETREFTVYGGSSTTTSTLKLDPLVAATNSVSGSATPGATVTVTVNGYSNSAIANGYGRFTVNLYFALKAGDTVYASQSINGISYGTTSAVVGSTTTPSALQAPVITYAVAGSRNVSGTGFPGASVSVRFDNFTYSDTVGSDGKWTVTTPVLLAGQTIVVTQTYNRVTSNPVTYVVGSGTVAPAAQFTVSQPRAEDIYVSGTGASGSKITVRDDSFNQMTTTVLADGTWKVAFGPLKAGMNIYVEHEGIKDIKNLRVAPKGSITEKPTVNPVRAGDTVLTGKALPYAKVIIQYAKRTVNTNADGQGNWKQAIFEASVGDVYTVSQETANGISDSVTVKALDKALVLAQPTVQPFVVGDTVIRGTGVPGATVTITNGYFKKEAIVDYFGKWSIDVGTIYQGSEYQVVQSNAQGVSAPLTVKPGLAVNASRIYGNDRIQTAIEMSRKFYTSSKNVVIARSGVPYDALSAAPLAGQLNAPILLSATQELDRRVMDEIRRLGATNIYILGSNQALSPSVESALRQMGTVTRLGGSTRYETSAMIAKEVIRLTGNNWSYFVVTGESFADALAIGSRAAQYKRPILLVKKNEVPAPTRAILDASNHPKLTIIGGVGVISEALKKDLDYRYATVERIAGSTRYETALEIAKKYFDTPKTVFVVNGDGFADALVAGPVAGANYAPILLTEKSAPSLSLQNYVKEKKPTTIYAVGGYSVIDQSTIDLLTR